MNGFLRIFIISGAPFVAFICSPIHTEGIIISMEYPRIQGQRDPYCDIFLLLLARPYLFSEEGFYYYFSRNSLRNHQIATITSYSSDGHQETRKLAGCLPLSPGLHQRQQAADNKLNFIIIPQEIRYSFVVLSTIHPSA